MGSLAAPVEQLRAELQRRLADAYIRIDAPGSAEGTWWVDVEHQGHSASVEWRPKVGFGVAGPHGGYGEGPDVVIQDAAAAADHVCRLLERSARADSERVQTHVKR